MKKIKLLFVFAIGMMVFTSCKDSDSQNDKKYTDIDMGDSIMNMKNRIENIVGKYTNSDRDYKLSFNDDNLIIVSTLEYMLKEYTNIDIIPIKMISNVIVEEYESRTWIVIKINSDSKKSYYVLDKYPIKIEDAYKWGLVDKIYDNLVLILDKSVNNYANVVCTDINELSRIYQRNEKNISSVVSIEEVNDDKNKKMDGYSVDNTNHKFSQRNKEIKDSIELVEKNKK